MTETPTPETDFDLRLRELGRRVKLFAEKVRRPRRWPLSRPLLQVPCVGLHLRREFRPFVRWTRWWVAVGGLGLCLTVLYRQPRRRK